MFITQLSYFQLFLCHSYCLNYKSPGSHESRFPFCWINVYVHFKWPFCENTIIFLGQNRDCRNWTNTWGLWFVAIFSIWESKIRWNLYHIISMIWRHLKCPERSCEISRYVFGIYRFCQPFLNISCAWVTTEPIAPILSRRDRHLSRDDPSNNHPSI